MRPLGLGLRARTWAPLLFLLGASPRCVTGIHLLASPVRTPLVWARGLLVERAAMTGAISLVLIRPQSGPEGARASGSGATASARPSPHLLTSTGAAAPAASPVLAPSLEPGSVWRVPSRA